MSQLLSSDDDDAFYDAKDRSASLRSQRLSEGKAREEDEDDVEALKRQRELIAQRRREAEARLQEEEKELERKISEVLRRQSTVSADDPWTAEAALGPGRKGSQDAGLVSRQDQSVRSKMQNVRDRLHHDITPQTSFDSGERIKVSSLERARATLSELDELTDPAKLVETLLVSQELTDENGFEISAVSTDPTGLGVATTTPVLLDQPRRNLRLSHQSTSTPVLRSEQPASGGKGGEHNVQNHLPSPITAVNDINVKVHELADSTPPSRRSAENRVHHPSTDSTASLSRYETLPGMDGDGHVTTNTMGDDKFATARGYLTLESQQPLTESEIRQYCSQNSTDSTTTPAVTGTTGEDNHQHVDKDLRPHIETPHRNQQQLYVDLPQPNNQSRALNAEPDIIQISRQSSAAKNHLSAARRPHPSRLVVDLDSNWMESVIKGGVDSPTSSQISRSSRSTSRSKDSTPSSGGSAHMTGLSLRHPDSLRFPGGTDTFLNLRDGSSLNMKTATLGRRHVSTQDDESNFDRELHTASTLPLSNRFSPPPSSMQDYDTEANKPSVYPLSAHMEKIVSEQSASDPFSKVTGNVSLASPRSADRDSDEEGSLSEKSTSSTSTQRRVKLGGGKLKKLLGKAMSSRKSQKNKDGQSEQTPTSSRILDSADNDSIDDTFTFRGTASSRHKGPYAFDRLTLAQDMSGEHSGPVWAIKFSPCGRLMATGGQDSVLRVWCLKSAHKFFDDMKQNYNETNITPSASADDLDHIIDLTAVLSRHNDTTQRDEEPEEESPFMNKIFMTYRGHTADILDLSWSKNYFLLSSSVDKTVRLWHISRNECLCVFQHIDFVTAIVFHPRDDRFFLSGSLDGKLRLWSIPDKKVALWNEVIGSGSKLITAVNFCQNGRFAVAGTYDGKCIFYSLEQQLKYFTTINVRSSRGKNAEGHKVTGIESLPHEDKILVTTNDSRLRLYDLRDLSLCCKYRGVTNYSSQIKASFSHDGQHILCGSEDHNIYFWKTYNTTSKFTTLRRDRNDCWEAINAHQAVMTSAVFAPRPSLFFKHASATSATDNTQNETHVTASARPRYNITGSLRSTDTLIHAPLGSGGGGNSSDSSKSSRNSWSRRSNKTNSLTKNLEPHYGYVIVAGDYTGSIKVLTKPAHN